MSVRFRPGGLFSFTACYILATIRSVWAYSIAVERFHGMEQVGVRLPVGPQIERSESFGPKRANFFARGGESKTFAMFVSGHSPRRNRKGVLKL